MSCVQNEVRDKTDNGFNEDILRPSAKENYFTWPKISIMVFYRRITIKRISKTTL
jgi:hypothetical protein